MEGEGEEQVRGGGQVRGEGISWRRDKLEGERRRRGKIEEEGQVAG